MRLIEADPEFRTIAILGLVETESLPLEVFNGAIGCAIEPFTTWMHSKKTNFLINILNFVFIVIF
jgi:hypothetical protein